MLWQKKFRATIHGEGKLLFIHGTIEVAPFGLAHYFLMSVGYKSFTKI